MSKYQPLWEYVSKVNRYSLKMSFDDIFSILGFSIDHSFLKYKKELTEYGYEVGKISMKEQMVTFTRI